jgi:hypothetical protein
MLALTLTRFSHQAREKERAQLEVPQLHFHRAGQGRRGDWTYRSAHSCCGPRDKRGLRLGSVRHSRLQLITPVVEQARTSWFGASLQTAADHCTRQHAMHANLSVCVRRSTRWVWGTRRIMSLACPHDCTLTSASAHVSR